MMLASILSGGIYGIDAFTVEVEVNVGGGDIFKPVVVGLPDAAVKESIDRVVTALLNSSLSFPTGRVTINLAPANVKKEGPIYDLPMALGMLVGDRSLEPEDVEGIMAVGELALSGEVRSVRGILPMAIHAKKMGVKALFVPFANAEEAAVVEGLTVYAVKTLREAVDFLAGDHELSSARVNIREISKDRGLYEDDFSDVKGQESARRAFEVACAGGHNILAIGPPGSGKTMLAKRVASIQPPLSVDEALETTKIHSIAGVLPGHQALVSQRPFRSPHHTVSDAGLLGGGTHPMPGEVSLAHNGVLFLDELPEFARNVLEVLRQPLEDGEVTISRAAATVTFPSRFQLVAAMNPCPCGYFGDPQRECRCSSNQIQKYLNKISGPLLDRIDIHIEVPAVHYDDLTSLEVGESSAAMQGRVLQARERQQERFSDNPRVHCNADMGSKQLRTHCILDEDSAMMLKSTIQQMNFSARAYDRICKVARTIADMEGAESISTMHLSEAIQYRTLDRQFWV